MGSPSEDYAEILFSQNPVEIGLVQNLMKQAGIPSLVHGPDFDIAELGLVGHHWVRGAYVYVPKAAEARAREILADAFTDVPPDDPAG